MEKIIAYASSGTGEMVSTIVIVILAIGVIFIGIKSFSEALKSKEDDPETAELKKRAKEELRTQASIWQEEVAILKEQYGGKVPPEVLQKKLAQFNQRYKVMQ